MPIREEINMLPLLAGKFEDGEKMRVSHAKVRLHVAEPGVYLREIPDPLILYLLQPLRHDLQIRGDCETGVRPNSFLPLIAAVLQYVLHLDLVLDQLVQGTGSLDEL